MVMLQKQRQIAGDDAHENLDQGHTHLETDRQQAGHQRQSQPDGRNSPGQFHERFPKTNGRTYSERLQCRRAARATRSRAMSPSRPLLTVMWYSKGFDQSMPK